MNFIETISDYLESRNKPKEDKIEDEKEFLESLEFEEDSVDESTPLGDETEPNGEIENKKPIEPVNESLEPEENKDNKTSETIKNNDDKISEPKEPIKTKTKRKKKTDKQLESLKKARIKAAESNRNKKKKYLEMQQQLKEKEKEIEQYKEELKSFRHKQEMNKKPENAGVIEVTHNMNSLDYRMLETLKNYRNN